MSLLQKSCVVTCDLLSLLILYLEDVFQLVLLIRMSGMERATAEANLHGNQMATKIASQKTCVVLECGQLVEELVQSSPPASPSSVRSKKEVQATMEEG